MPTESSENLKEPEGTLVDALLYGLSLPERTARSASLIVGGLVNETAARLIPAAFRSSRSYTLFVQQALDMMVTDVGGVQSSTTADPSEETQLARKAVGGLLDVAGTATLHLSPMTVLAAFSDIAYGSSYYLRKLSEELKSEGIIDEDSSIDHVSDLIQALESTSARAVKAMDTPPISISGFTDTIAQLTDELSRADPASLLPQEELQRLWGEMEQAAQSADVGLWDISTTMTMFALNRVTLTTRGALSTINVAGDLFDEHIISHYNEALMEIGQHGLYATLSDAATPYLEGIWENFAEDRETWTEELLTGRLIEKGWRNVRGWFLPSP